MACMSASRLIFICSSRLLSLGRRVCRQCSKQSPKQHARTSAQKMLRKHSSKKACRCDMPSWNALAGWGARAAGARCETRARAYRAAMQLARTMSSSTP